MFCLAPHVKIWNLTVDANSDYANISWKHNLPVGSSVFVLESTLDSKTQILPLRAYEGNLSTLTGLART